MTSNSNNAPIRVIGGTSHARARHRELTPGYVSIVCVTHNSSTLLPAFFASLPQTSAGLPVDVHISDSGSSDSTVADARRLKDDATVHVMDGNRGFAAGINVALAYLAQREVHPSMVVIVNPDTRFHSHTLEYLASAMEQRPSAGVVIPRLVDQDGRLQLSLRRAPTVSATLAEALFGGPLAHRLGFPTEVIRDRKVYTSSLDVGWATGGFLAVSWPCLDAVGKWDESYFLYEEEVDFCLRAIDKGYLIHYTPHAVATRLIESRSTAPWIQALMRINRVRHVRKRAGRYAAGRVRIALMFGDAVRGLAGRREARASLWALVTAADVVDVLKRYRPDSHATIPAPPHLNPPADSSFVDVFNLVTAYVDGAEVDGFVASPDVLEAARRHDVLSLVCSMADPDEAVTEIRRSRAVHALRLENALAEVGRVLGDAEIDWILLKGAVLSEITYRVPDMRDTADLDLLVRPDDFERAVSAIQLSGGTLLDCNWPLICEQERGELAIVTRDGVLLDLHWHLINEREARSESVLETEALFDHARRVVIGRHTVWTLDDVDTAVHATVHAWKSGGNRLKWLLDVQQSVRRVGDESRVRLRARSFGVELPTLLIMRRAERVIGGLPKSSSSPSIGWRIILGLDRRIVTSERVINPYARRLFSGEMLLRASRDSLRVGLRAMARSLRDSIRYRFGYPSGQSQADLRRLVESADNRKRYFAAVRTHGRVARAG